MCNIIVLMSTYNGEKYLKKQIDSIISQTIKVKLIVRDDGSKDKTQIILEKYKKQGKLDWYQGENIGFAKSFLTLLKNAPKADFYAFADQDDYWLANKLEIAIKRMQKETVPCLYCSNVDVVDENLNYLPRVYYRKNIDINTNFESTLLANISPGCTMVFNSVLAKCINKYMPSKIKYHDWWVALLGATFGKVIYDKNSYIKYRQHSGNVIGCKFKHDFKWTRNKIMLKNNTVRWNFGIPYFKELLSGYGNNLSNYQVQVLKDMINFSHSYKARLRLFFNKNMSFKNLKGLIYRKIFILLGKN